MKARDIARVAAKEAYYKEKGVPSEICSDAAADIYDGTLMAIYIILENYELLDTEGRLEVVENVRKIVKSATGMD